MSETIAFHFDNLQNLLLPPTIIELTAALLVLALGVVSLYLLTKLKSARAIIGQLAKSLGYEPPYGDGSEIFDQEYKKEIVENGREKKIEQLEERIVGFEREIANKDAESASNRQTDRRSSEHSLDPSTPARLHGLQHIITCEGEPTFPAQLLHQRHELIPVSDVFQSVLKRSVLQHPLAKRQKVIERHSDNPFEGVEPVEPVLIRAGKNQPANRSRHNR